MLVVHAHGGPVLGPPQASRADEDARRWAVTVQLGHAWAGSVLRQGGFAVATAAEDTERMRRIFVQHVGQPRRTLLHGQIWGAMVAARAGAMYPKSWEGIPSTSGVAGPAAYDSRLDLRAIYQLLCGSHPRPDEPAHPLAVGLPAGSGLTGAELAARADACLGLRLPAAQRTPAAQGPHHILSVLKSHGNSIAGHLDWGTFTLRDVVQKAGGPPFGNPRVRYAGSDEGAGLNAGLDAAGLRFTPDTAAERRFVADVDRGGRFAVPVPTTHGTADSIVFVEGHDTLRRRMEAAGHGARLVQTFVESGEHGYLGDAIYPPLFEALLAWVERGTKPTPAGIAERCRALRAAAPAECRFVVDHAARPLASRVAPR